MPIRLPFDDCRIGGQLALVVAAFVGLAACGPRNTPTPTATLPASQVGPAYSGMQLEALPGYQATFELLFAGQRSWKYQLELRADAAVVEYQLHVEGPGAEQNPGDIRLVTSGGITRMRGPGTQDECLQFPSDIDPGKAFVTPDQLVAPKDLAPNLQWVAAEELAGVASHHYAARQSTLGAWENAQVDVWLNDPQGSTLAYNLVLSGNDPLFDGGQGILAGTFRVNAVGPQMIEPIAGCEIDLPLPADAMRLVKLPGLVRFDSAASAADTAAFYQTRLPEAGWQVEGEPEAAGEAVVLAFRRGEETLTVNIEAEGAGVAVELLLAVEP